MEAASLIVSILSALAAGASALYAIAANRRAREANQTTREALDLQARIDAREREFRDVRWSIGIDEPRTVRIRNIGLTTACSVTLVLTDGYQSERFALGDIGAGEQRTAESHRAEAWMDEVKEFMPISPPCRILWSSELGTAEEYSAEGAAFFEAPE